MNCRIRKTFTLLLIFVLLISITHSSVAASERQVQKNVYLIILNRYSLTDVKQMPNLKKIIDDGSIGLMNTRGLYSYNGAEGFLTINTSSRAYANYSSSEFHNFSEENKEIYERRIGQFNGEHEVLNTNFSILIELNKDNTYAPNIGALGDNLHKSGLKTAIYGNADTLDDIIRPSCLIPMDSKGLIDYGNVDNILTVDKQSPYGFRTDYNKILEDIGRVKDKASLIVIDTGDLDRLSSYSNKLTEEMFMLHRERILSSIDSFLGELVKSIDKNNSIIMISSPNSGEELIDNSKLSPTIVWGSDISKGILSSSTTRRDGLISNIDIAPTIVDFLNIPSEGFLGSPLVYKDYENNLSFIENTNSRINLISNSRFYLLTIYGVLSIIALSFGAFILSFKISLSGKLYNILTITTLTIGIIPLCLILNSIINVTSYSKFIVFSIILVIIFIVSFYYQKRFNKFLIPMGLTYIVLLIDVLSGGNLIRYSVLGYDPTIGARYFGIGNELVGILLGSMAVFIGILARKKWTKALSLLIMFLTILAVGHPRFGANAGGTIAVVFMALYFVLEMKDVEISFKKVIGIGFVTGIFIMVLGFLDAKINPNPTHLGRAIIMASRDGTSFINNVALRKILMNIKLVGSSIWTKVLYVNLLSQIAIILTIKDKIRELFNKNKYIFIGFSSGIVGSIIGFLVNDSGLILSSLSMLLITISFIWTVAEYISKYEN